MSVFIPFSQSTWWQHPMPTRPTDRGLWAAHNDDRDRYPTARTRVIGRHHQRPGLTRPQRSQATSRPRGVAYCARAAGGCGHNPHGGCLSRRAMRPITTLTNWVTMAPTRWEPHKPHRYLSETPCSRNTGWNPRSWTAVTSSVYAARTVGSSTSSRNRLSNRRPWAVRRLSDRSWAAS